MARIAVRVPWRAACLAVCAGLAARAAAVQSPDGLSAQGLAATPLDLYAVALDGQALAGVAVRFAVRAPHAAEPAPAGFAISGGWAAHGRCLEARGAVSAPGEADIAADLVVRIEGCALALGRMAEEPLLLPRRLLGKLPLVSLRSAGEDRLALAIPPDALACFDVREADGAVELRFPFGFTAAGPESLRMRAPFALVLYRTEPRWHFRSALAGYYELFPAAFESRATAFGGWFFAAPTRDLPNPQHFYYHEGGPQGDQDDAERGLGTFPYRESSSLTVSLPGSDLPKSYDEAMTRLQALEQQKVASRWDPMHHFELDAVQPREGSLSLRVHNEKAGQWGGTRQSVSFAAPMRTPFVIQGWSRAEGVSGTEDNDYALYVDVCYADGSYLFGQCARFAPGTHDWAPAECRVTPAKPVAELRVYALLRGAHTGTAWFDDLRIGPVDQPGTNWLGNPGFEQTAARADLTFLRDNVCTDAQDRMVVSITDNLSADVGPAAPMNLLRFTLNVDPDLPERLDHPTVAAREVELFDRMLRDFPRLAGLYIDSVSAWCSRVLNTRRDQWIANDAPFTYDAGRKRVAAAGLFGTRDYLAALQHRYNPKGKLIFTNIHCSHDAFPLYLVSDAPGIESSQFRSEDDLFFYRACSYRKPLLLMNFINLHGLDQRTVAEDFHLNAAFWGEIPSTGRFVQRAYQEYGDVTHAYLPTIRELAAAGWQPVPLCRGPRAERFADGDAGAVMWTVRRQAGQPDVLSLEGEALAGMSDDLVAMDPVWLAPRPLRRLESGWEVDLTAAPPVLSVVRVMSRDTVVPWLLGRAAEHIMAASRVQGTASALSVIGAARAALTAVDGKAPGYAELEAVRQAIGAAMAAVPGAADNLFALSQRRELQQARQAVESLALFLSGAAAAGLEGDRTAHAGIEMSLRPSLPPGAHGLRCLGLSRSAGRPVVPSLEPTGAPASVPERFQAPAPGVYTVRAVFEADIAGMAPIRFERVTCQTVLPGARLKLEGAGSENGRRRFRLAVTDAATTGLLRVAVTVAPLVDGVTPVYELASAQEPLNLAVPAALDGLQRRLRVEVSSAGGVLLASAEAAYIDEPGVPAVRVPVTTCRADSSYSGYSPEVVSDGSAAVEGLHWTRRAWASSDSAGPHWLSLDFGTPRRVSGALIFWNVEDARVYASRRYRVLVETAGGQREVATVEDDRARTCDRLTWAPVEATGLRLEQDAGAGPSGRPNILWLREVAVTEADARP